ncbi:AcidPPc domain-containing protein [Aphelenchoides besseyi]|nr:AcidPPc domain-containing protein [Aphelenchoides besseyi]
MIVNNTNITVDNEKRTMSSRPIPLPYIHFGIDVLAIVALFISMEFVAHHIGPHKSGFYCDDKTIRLPYRSSTVGFWGLIGYCIFINFITILAVECCRLYLLNDKHEYSIYESHRTRFQRLLIRFCIFFTFYLSFEFLITILTTVTKLSIGRLRPHFLDVCRPLVTLPERSPIQLTQHSACTGLENIFIDISNYTCTAKHPEFVTELYMQYRLVDQIRCRLVVPVLQICCLGCGLFISYSRIFDYKHHWTDVAVGIFVGVAGMLLMCRYIGRFFHYPIVQVLPPTSKASRDSNHTTTTGLEVPTSKRSFEWNEAYA